MITMVILFIYLTIFLNFVFSSEQRDVPAYRNEKAFGTHEKEAFVEFHDHYYDRELLKKIAIDYSDLNFKKIIKEDNEEDLKICFGWSPSLTLQNRFVKTNLTEFIRYSPLYFKSVVEDIKKKRPYFLKSICFLNGFHR